MEKSFSFGLGVAQYLQIKDKLQLSRTSKLIRQMLLTAHNWKAFEISDFGIKPDHWENYIAWVEKYIQIIQPSQLIFILLDESHEEDQRLLKIIMEPRQSIECLTIRTNSQLLHLALASSCTNATKIIFQSHCITDQLAQHMFKYLKKVSQIEINIDTLEFTCKNISKYLSNPLRKLVLKPYRISYQELILLVRNESLNELNQLQIDVEECEQNQLIEIISNLKHITRLRLYHMQRFQSIQYPKLLASKLSYQMKELTLTKCYHINLAPIMYRIASPHFQNLDLTEATKLTNDSVFLLAQSCTNLKRINLSWCNQVSNKSVGLLIRNCKALQRVVLTGVKSLNDEAFDEYTQFKPQFSQKKYDQIKYSFRLQCKNSKQSQIPAIDQKYKQQSKLDNLFKMSDKLHNRRETLTNLRYLQCNSCNSVSDTILKIIYCFNRMSQVINYYGEDVSLSRNSFQQEFIN